MPSWINLAMGYLFFFPAVIGYWHSNLEGGGILEPTSELSATSQKYVKKGNGPPPKKWD